MTGHESSYPITLPIESAVIEQALHMDGFDVHLCAARTPAEIQVVRPIASPIIQHVPSGGMIDRVPAFRLDHKGAQCLMDALWKAGVRPSSGMGAPADAQLVAALQDHIADLRAVAQLTKPVDRPTYRGEDPRF